MNGRAISAGGMARNSWREWPIAVAASISSHTRADCCCNGALRTDPPLCPPRVDAGVEVHPKDLVGRTIKVYWPDDCAFYSGKVVGYDSGTMQHKVRTGMPQLPAPVCFLHCGNAASSHANLLMLGCHAAGAVYRR